MGKVVVPVVVFSTHHPRRGETLKALVDTGAMLSVIPSPVLRRLGIRPTDRLAVRLADGRVVRRSVGEARLKITGHVVTSRVLFGKLSDATLLGLVALESLGLAVDPSKGKIVKSEVLLLGVTHARSGG